MDKKRLDVILVEKGYFESRERAKASIMAGVVYVNGNREDKPGARFLENAALEIKKDINPYVSRGGIKLEKALKHFNIDLEGKTAIDVGASTGGFTDCMLKNGAIKVIAIDVGYGQFAWELRTDPRVVCLERTNIRYVKPSDIGISAEFAAVDVSFISLKKVLPAIKKLLKDDGEIICLVKPQFEAGREKVGKHGVVRDPDTHKEVLDNIIEFARENGFHVKGLTYSPVKGPEGNIEYLLYISNVDDIGLITAKTSSLITGIPVEISKVVDEAHRNL